MGVLISMSRGVAMLKELEYKINSTIIDQEGNYILIYIGI